MSYGHGISVSLLQLAHAYQVFAGDGEIRPLTLLKRDAPPEATRVISAATAAQVRQMLEMAVQPGGTAPRAQIAGYRVAGKTGTAHKLDGANYAPDKYVASFVGFAPAFDPQLIVAVMIDEPGDGQYYGGTVAAPVFSNVMAGALRLLGVKPDAPLNNVVLPPPRRNARGSMNADRISIGIRVVGAIDARSTSASSGSRPTAGVSGAATLSSPIPARPRRPQLHPAGDRQWRAHGAVGAARLQMESSWRVPNLGIADLRARAGLIASHVYGDPSARLWMVGVTGTNGKTTCSQWIARALSDNGKRSAVIGTLGYGLRGARRNALRPLVNTTPDAVWLHAQLAEFKRRGARAASMEVSSIGLDQDRVAGVRFDVALFTNLTRDHSIITAACAATARPRRGFSTANRSNTRWSISTTNSAPSLPRAAIAAG